MTIRSITKKSLGITTLCTAFGLFVTVQADPLLRPDLNDIDQEINSVLHLEDSWHTTLKIDQKPERPISIEVPLGSRSFNIELEPFSIRADEYQIMMQDDNGKLYEVPAGPVRTLRGSVAEVSGSVVAASLMVDGLHARIRLGNGTEFWMEPVGEKISG